MTNRRDGQRGQGLTEIALLLPVILLIFMGLFDFGRAIVTYNSVAEAARNGARVAIVNQVPSDICRIVAERAVTLSLATTCAPNASAAGVYVSASTGGQSCTTYQDSSGVPCTQSVQVTTTFTPITPIIGAVLGPIELRSSTTLPVESLCASSCPQT